MKHLINHIWRMITLAALLIVSVAHAQVTSVGSQSINNLIPNGGFEQGRAKWKTFSTTIAGGIPTSAPAACSSCTITTFQTTTFQKLAGAVSLNTASTGAVTAGQGFISNPFTIPNGLSGKALAWELQYQVQSGLSNMLFKGDATNTWAIYYWDATNLKWVQPTLGLYAFIQGVGPGVASGSVQFDSNTTSVQVAVIAMNATTGAVSMNWDDLRLRASAPNTDGRVISMYGAMVSQTVTAGTTNLAFTATRDSHSAWTGSTYVVPVSGDYMVTATAVSSAGGATMYLFVNGASGPYIGATATAANSTTGGAVLAAPLKAGDVVSIRTTTNTTFSNGNIGIFRVAGPTSGDEGRAVTAQLQSLSTQSIPSATYTQISGFYTISDSHGGFGSNSYTAPIAGAYLVKMNVFYAAAAGVAASPSIQCAIYKNGVSASNDLTGGGGTASITRSCTNTALLMLKAGDVLSFYTFQDTNSAQTLAAAGGHNVTIARLSGPNVPQSQFDVPAARYTSTAGPAIGTTFAVIDFGTKDYDSAGLVTTGAGWIFRAPVAGKYLVNLNAYTQQFTCAAGTAIAAKIYKNGSFYSRVAQATCESTALVFKTIAGADSVTMQAGDVIDIRMARDPGISPALGTTPGDVSLTVYKVAN